MSDVSTTLSRAPWRRFVAIGDSITEGYGMDPVDGIEHIPWAPRVASALRMAQPDLMFANLAYRKLLAAEIRDQQVDRALELRPDLVSVTAGANDLLLEHFDCEGVERALGAIFAPLVESGATVFTYTYMNITASGLLPPDGAAWLADRMEALHAAARRAAARHGAQVIDLWSLPDSGDAGCFSKDLQHANARGQLYVAQRTVEHLAAHLLEREASERREHDPVEVGA